MDVNGHEKEKMLKSDPEFRGYVIAKLEYMDRMFVDHLKDEMKELKKITEALGALDERIQVLENWKLRVVTLASAVSGVVGLGAGYLMNLFQ